MATHTEKGRFGEEIALRLLQEKKYIIHERNWRYLHKEVDIIAQEGHELVFVEVKFRTSDRYGTAVQGVNSAKRTNLIVAANYYVRSKRINLSTRFDIIAVDMLPEGGYKVEHIKRAFYPTASSRPCASVSKRTRIPKLK